MQSGIVLIWHSRREFIALDRKRLLEIHYENFVKEILGTDDCRHFSLEVEPNNYTFTHVREVQILYFAVLLLL